MRPLTRCRHIISSARASRIGSLSELLSISVNPFFSINVLIPEIISEKNGLFTSGSRSPTASLSCRDSVRAALAALPADCREILTLREIGGLSYEELAIQLGLEPGTVKSRLNRARKKMCALLLQSGNFSHRDPSNRGREV